MALSDEAKKKRDELALEQDTQYWGPGVGEHFKDGFDAGYEFCENEEADLLGRSVERTRQLQKQLEQERARSQKLIKVLEIYAQMEAAFPQIPSYAKEALEQHNMETNDD